MIKFIFPIALLAFPLCAVIADEPLTDELIYNDGSVQVTSEISPYEILTPHTPVQGSVMVTHNAGNKVDINTFRLGDKPLKVTLLQSIPMSSNSPIVVSIYNFQLEGMEGGSHTLPPIKVKIGGKDFEAPPLSIQVGD